MFFAEKYIKIIFYFLKFIFNIAHQNNSKILKKINFNQKKLQNLGKQYFDHNTK
jgi:hypothetical protein